MTPRDLNIWRTDHDLTQVQLAERLGIATNTVARWECGARAIPEILPLALKGLSFTHGPLCSCTQCYRRYPRPARALGRDVRETRPARLPVPAPAAAQEAV